MSFFGHAIEWVESTGEVTFEGLASGNDLRHDLVSLHLGDTWTEWVSSEVSSNSDSSGNNHCGVLLSEVGISDTGGGHV